MATQSSEKNTDLAKALSMQIRSGVLFSPRITEKASAQAAQGNVYVFNVDRAATKFAIKKAVQELYKVTPVKVATVNIPSKTIFVRGKYGQTKQGKKAYIYLKKGDTIEFV